MADQKLYRADLAALLGVQVDTLNRYKLPPRDGTDIELGKARPYWWRATAESWIAQRPGRGARTDIIRTADTDQADPPPHSGP